VTEQGFNLGPFAHGWPTAPVRLDLQGFYYCADGGAVHLGTLAAWLASEFGPVIVTEL